MTDRRIVAVRRPMLSWAYLAVTLLLVGAENASAQQQISIPRNPANGYVGLSYRPTDFTEADVQKRALPFVIAVVPCSPAHFAGVEPGDVLLRVNDQDSRGRGLFRGTIGTEYQVTLRRADELYDLRFVRVELPTQMPAPVRTSPMGSTEEWNCSSSQWFGAVEQ